MLFKKSLIRILLLASVSAQLLAHPHTWINLQSTFVLNEKFELTEIKQQWQFDEYYSAMFISDMLNEYGADRDMAFALAGENMVDSLLDYQYFSSLSVDQAGISIGQPSEYKLFSVVIDGADILTMTMTFSVSLKPNIKLSNIEWSVYDPTYYVAMEHNELTNLVIQNGEKSGCVPKMNKPEPSEETIAYASSLDKTQTETQGLGVLFAETVRFGCL